MGYHYFESRWHDVSLLSFVTRCDHSATCVANESMTLLDAVLVLRLLKRASKVSMELEMFLSVWLWNAP